MNFSPLQTREALSKKLLFSLWTSLGVSMESQSRYCFLPMWLKGTLGLSQGFSARASWLVILLTPRSWRVREGQQSTAASAGVMSTLPGMVYETQFKKITSFLVLV